MTEVEIEIPPRSPYVGVVRLALASLGRVIDLDDDSLEDLKTAVSEVCSNSVLLSEEAREARPVSIKWYEEPTRVIVEVLDHVSHDDEDPAESVDSQGFSSRLVMSRALVETLVTECHIVPEPGGGTRTRLILER